MSLLPVGVAGRRAGSSKPRLPGYDRGGTPKDPAPRCVRWPHRQNRKVTLPATRSVLKPRIPGEHSGERSGGYGFSGCRARLWGGAAVCASGRRGQSLPPMGAAAWPYGAFRTTSNGGFALHEAFRGCVAGVSEPHVVQFPRLVKVLAWLWLVWCPKRRPPRRKTVKTGCCGRSGLRFGHNSVWHGVLFARKPLNMRVNP